MPALSSIPPLPPTPDAGPLSRLSGFVRIEALRLVRGWRLRGLFAISVLAAWWFSRTETFGEGLSVYFPAGDRGLVYFGALFAAAGLVLGVDSWGVLERHRYARLYERRMFHSVGAILSRLLVSAGAVAVIGAVVTWWPSIGAWRADWEVVWSPPAYYFATVLVPLIVAGVACGLFARTLLPSDTAAIGLALVLLAPAGWYALQVAEPWNIFLRSSLQLGSLVPASVLLADAAVVSGYALLWLGGTLLLVPHTRERSPIGSSQPPRPSRVPSLRRVANFLGGRPRVLTGASVGAAAAMIVAGAWPLYKISRERTIPEFSFDLARSVPPVGIADGRIEPVRIVARELRIEDPSRRRLLVTLSLRPTTQNQRFTAFGFGRVLTVDPDSIRGAVLHPRAVNVESTLHVFEFPTPLTEETTHTVTLALRPKEGLERIWDAAFHPRFHSLARLGAWYGQSAGINYANADYRVLTEPSVYTIDVPAHDSLEWYTRADRREERGGRLLLHRDRPGVPNALIAGNLVALPAKDIPYPLTWLVFPEHRAIADGLSVAYRDPLRRLYRIFGEPKAPIVFYEVPEQRPADHLALPSAVLDKLQSLLPYYSDWERPTAGDFDWHFINWHTGAVSEFVNNSWDDFSDPALLRDAALVYLDQYALDRGQSRAAVREMRRDPDFMPWDRVRLRFTRTRLSASAGFGGPGAGNFGNRGGGFGSFGGAQRESVEVFPFDLREAEIAGFRGPIDPRLRRPGEPAVPQLRAVAFHHMLRGLLGEDKYVAFVREIWGRGGDGTLTIGALQAAAERHAGESLEWFFRQWLLEGVIPELRLRDLRAVLSEDPNTRTLRYTTTVTVANDGDGRMPVPWVLETEGDVVENRVWLGPGEEQKLTVETIDRPVAFALDPDGWILQLPEYDPAARAPVHPKVFIRAIAEE